MKHTLHIYAQVGTSNEILEEISPSAIMSNEGYCLIDIDTIKTEATDNRDDYSEEALSFLQEIIDAAENDDFPREVMIYSYNI